MTACSARPAELERFALGALTESDRVVHVTGPLTDALDHWAASVNKEFGELPRVDDQALAAVRSVRKLAEWVHLIGAAFTAADSSDLSQPDAADVQAWLLNATWSPKMNVLRGSHADWANAVYGNLDFYRRCIVRDYGYEGAGSNVGGGFVRGPDGRVYPLVAPFVTREGIRYNEDNGAQAGALSVWALDGRDPGWVTIDVRGGIERFVDEPGVVDRMLGAAGATVVGGLPARSTVSQVRAVDMKPGAMPSIEPTSAPPVHPGIPEGDPTGPASPVVDAIAPVSQAALAIMQADHGSTRAYQVVFQQNQHDGRTRAIYTTVRVIPPNSDNEEFILVPERVLGPESNGIEPVEPVVYAPGSVSSTGDFEDGSYRVHQPR